ncbi:hypothetical protein ACOSQ2_005393 [Xanthoceras sorbifolium]
MSSEVAFGPKKLKNHFYKHSQTSYRSWLLHPSFEGLPQWAVVIFHFSCIISGPFYLVHLKTIKINIHLITFTPLNSQKFYIHIFKIIYPKFGMLHYWCTFLVGCAFDESIVHHKYFKENADYNNLAYNTKYEVYSKGCGLNNVMMSWGHDDSMYLVAKENKTTLPSAALFIIRYHSFYPLHRSGVYKNLINKEDVENLKWLQAFKVLSKSALSDAPL